MNNKKILFVANAAWNIYNFRMPAMLALRNAGYDVCVVAPYDEYSKHIENAGFTVHNIGLDGNSINPLKDILSFVNYLKLYSFLKPDLIFHFTIKPCVYGSLAAGILGIKNISVITGLGYAFINNTFVSKVACFLYSISLKFAYEVWFQNSDDANEFLSRKIIKPSKTISILPGSGVSTQKFVGVERNKQDEFCFLLVARILWDKGVGEYVEAAKILKQKYANVKFAILGSLDVKNPKAATREYIMHWSENGVIEYFGVSDDVRTYIANCDCVVLPSYREGVPRSLLEAASMQKPIVTTDVPGCREVVIDGTNGFLCAHKNPIDLSNKLEKMLMLEEGVRKMMGLAGRQMVVEKFDESIIVKKYIDSVRKILGT